MLLKTLEKNLQIVEQEIESLYEQRRKASPEAKGSIENKITQQKQERETLLKEIEEEKAKIKAPDEVKIFCYVLVSTKEKVRTNLQELGDVCACLFEEDDRYHDTDCAKWRPFKTEGYISEILEEFKERYSFEEGYLDGDLEDEKWVLINENLKQTIAIVDLLSLDDKNRDIAIRFDTPLVHTIMPVCRLLPPEVNSFAEKQESIFKVARAYFECRNTTDLFYSDSARIGNFKRTLTTIFRKKFIITNQSSVQSPIRNMSMNLT